MAWVRLDDMFHAHPKLALLGDLLLPAVGLHTLALTWSANYRTDGGIPLHQVTRLGGSTALANALVEAGLWEPADGGYDIHDFLEYNPSRVELEATAERRVSAGRENGRRSGHARRRKARAAAGQTPSNGEAPVNELPTNPKASDERATGNRGVRDDRDCELTDPAGQSDTSASRTPVPDPDPDPVPDPAAPSRNLRKEVSSVQTAKARPDVAALKKRLGRISPGQRRVLDEILDRHDAAGPTWSAKIISSTPPDEDPLKALMAHDRAWQEERRARVTEQEQSWTLIKRNERGTAQDGLERLGAIVQRSESSR